MNPGILTRPDPMGRSFGFAILFHASVFGVLLAFSLIHPSSDRFGDPNAGGVSVGVEAVDKIPIPHEGPSNPVAHNTEQEAAQAPPDKVEQEKKEVVPPDAIKLNLHPDKKKKAKEESVKHHFKSFEELEASQLTSKTPQAVSSPLFSQMPGSGRVGTGMNTTLGTQYAAYAQQIQALIARNWNTGDVTVTTAPVVTASFELMKDGSIRNLKIVQSSGVPSLDFSVKRAIDITFPPLPPGFPRNSATCEFNFELKK